jgi:hypothetical protein
MLLNDLPKDEEKRGTGFIILTSSEFCTLSMVTPFWYSCVKFGEWRMEVIRFCIKSWRVFNIFRAFCWADQI